MSWMSLWKIYLRTLLKEVVDQFQQKCLLSFSKNRSGVPFLKSDMPRVLMPGETAAKKQEAYDMIQRTMEDIMARHNTAFLNMFRQMMVSVFGLGVEKVLSRTSRQGPNGETGESSAAVNGQPPQDASAQPPQQSWVVSRSSSRNLIRQCLMHAHMERWHSVLLEFHLALLIG
jgi:hypothetical protein